VRNYIYETDAHTDFIIFFHSKNSTGMELWNETYGLSCYTIH